MNIFSQFFGKHRLKLCPRCERFLHKKRGWTKPDGSQTSVLHYLHVSRFFHELNIAVKYTYRLCPECSGEIGHSDTAEFMRLSGRPQKTEIKEEI